MVSTEANQEANSSVRSDLKENDPCLVGDGGTTSWCLSDLDNLAALGTSAEAAGLLLLVFG